MTTSLAELASVFTNIGGEFVTSVEELAPKASQIKAFIFDWDGVFNDGTKDNNGSSNFSEIDSMGTNLLRFGWWLGSGGTLPLMFIISGERNLRSFQLTKREHYHAAYFGIKHKTEALNHLMAQYQLQPHEIAFFFDDALDLSLAEICGLRLMVRHKGNPLFRKYVLDRHLTDYLTGSQGHEFAVREGCELLLGLRQLHDTAVLERQRFRPHYEQYYAQRQAVESQYFTITNGIFEQKQFEQL